LLTQQFPEGADITAQTDFQATLQNYIQRNTNMTDNQTSVSTKSDRQATTAQPSMESWRPFEALRHEIDRVFDGFGLAYSRSPGHTTPSHLEQTRDHGTAAFTSPAVDITQKDNTYQITAELPGLSDKDVEVHLNGTFLTIQGEKRKETEKHTHDHFLNERHYGRFTRSFQLPADADHDKIKAHFTDGILRIHVARTSAAQPHEKKILVTVD
jgi:HSP20 family protein